MIVQLQSDTSSLCVCVQRVLCSGLEHIWTLQKGQRTSELQSICRLVTHLRVPILGGSCLTKGRLHRVHVQSCGKGRDVRRFTGCWPQHHDTTVPFLQGKPSTTNTWSWTSTETVHASLTVTTFFARLVSEEEKTFPVKSCTRFRLAALFAGHTWECVGEIASIAAMIDLCKFASCKKRICFVKGTPGSARVFTLRTVHLIACILDTANTGHERGRTFLRWTVLDFWRKKSLLRTSQGINKQIEGTPRLF